MGVDGWVGASVQPLQGERLLLEPLRVEHADEMAAVLHDPALHAFTGAQPATRDELRSRYAQQVVGRSADGSERWLNWVVRRRDDGQALGFVQATVTEQDAQFSADVAWVIGVVHQGHGYAREAATLMVEWLREQGVRVVTAHVHPDHHASASIARWIGLAPTQTHLAGEIRWQG